MKKLSKFFLALSLVGGAVLLNACDSKSQETANATATTPQATQTMTTENLNTENLQEDAKVGLHVYGVVTALQTKEQFGLSDDELKYFAQEVLKAVDSKATFESVSLEDQKKAQAFLQERAQKVSLAAFNSMLEKNKKAGVEAIQAFVKDGATLDVSGVAYKIFEQGKGQQIKDTDTVLVNYKGTHLDGSVFDEKQDEKAPIAFPLDKVIEGFKIALTKLNVGGSMKVMIPSDKAYGDSGVQNAIQPGETLVFEITVRGVEGAKKAEPAKPTKSKKSK